MPTTPSFVQGLADLLHAADSEQAASEIMGLTQEDRDMLREGLSLLIAACDLVTDHVAAQTRAVDGLEASLDAWRRRQPITVEEAAKWQGVQADTFAKLRGREDPDGDPQMYHEVRGHGVRSEPLGDYLERQSAQDDAMDPTRGAPTDPADQ